MSAELTSHFVGHNSPDAIPRQQVGALGEERAVISFDYTRDAALLFYGASMLLAAARGYAGCEVLAITNWVLRRDDQVGCVLFSPLDEIESKTSGSAAASI